MRGKRCWNRVAACLSVVAVSAASPALFGAVSFTGVGALGTAGSEARALSSDGTVVVGASQNNAGETEAFLWSTTGGLAGLGFPPIWDAVNYSVATGVDTTATGDVRIAVTGQRDYFPDPVEHQAFLWSGDKAGVGSYNVVDMILFSGGFATFSEGLAVQAANGETMMTGYGKASDWNGMPCENWHGFRWREMPSMLELGRVFGGTYPVYGRGISDNGRIAGQLQYGATTPCSGGRQAFLWSGSAFHLIPFLAGGDENLANAIGRDGEYCVGRSKIAGGSYQAFVARVNFATTTPVISVTAIPFLPGDDYADALATSGQAERVGGRSRAGDGPSRAFVWDPTSGVQDVKEWLLSQHGIDVAADGWSALTEVRGISADGSAMAGNGIRNGLTEGWLVTGLPILPPAIDEVTPDPYPSDAGVEYKRQLKLSRGLYTNVTWEIVTCPSGLTVNPTTGFVYGWTPGLADVGTTVTIAVRATNAAGSFTETWGVKVGNQGPGPGGSATGVAPVLYPTTTMITVKGITSTGETSRVTLYRLRDGVETLLTYADERYPRPNFVDGVHDFPINPGDLQVGDIIRATQVRNGIESERSWPRVVFEPIPNPQAPPHLFWGFSDDFESSPIKPFWQLEEPMTLTSIHARDAQALLEDSVSGGRMAMDAAPGNYQLATQDRNPVLFEFWMYEEGVPPYTNAYARHVAGIQDAPGGGYNVLGSATTHNWLFEIGLLPGVRQPVRGPADPTRYQYRCTQGNPSRLSTGNMDEPGCPLRSPGWHRFSIKVAANKVYYYVDGILGHKELNTNPAINAAYVGTWSGNTGVTNVGSGSDPIYVELDGHTAYYDNISLRQIVNHLPVMDVTELNVSEGSFVSADITATDTDTPDLVTLTHVSGALPAGLLLSANTASGSPTAKITVQGTPEPGTAGTYVLEFTASDDLPAGTITGTVTINVSGCKAPPQDVDGDGDVDLRDFETFQACFNGANRPWPGPPIPQAACACIDADKDLDVDLTDFGVFQSCFNGPNRPPACP